MPPLPPQQPPRKKRRVGRVVLFTSLGVIGWFAACGTGAAMGSGGSSDAASTTSTSSRPASTVTATEAGPVVTVTKQAKAASRPTVTVTRTETVTSGPVDRTKPSHASKPAAAGTVVFKVWGTGSVDAQYGDDGSNIQGPSAPGWTRTMKLDDDAMYYTVTAQLQGRGNVHCSVTIDGKTKKGHAVGSYNICSAQLNADFLGGWG
ncbi:MAG: hypothetical protein J2P24_00270 [Streptosporangiales bacterium]|nr:hypothetical protein [Streptosporangiales bacterium]